MWRTKLGNRVLEGKEAEFYITATNIAVDVLHDPAVSEEYDSACRTGDRIFDSASLEQKIVLLHQCLSALIKPEVEMLKLTNLTEAAAFFPFAVLEMKIEEEIEDESYWEEDDDSEEDLESLIYFYRKLVWSTYKALFPLQEQSLEGELEEESEEPWLDWRSTQMSDWETAIDGLGDRIFFDRDWQITHLHPQMLDGLSESFTEQTGIEDDYIVNRLPKVTPQEFEAALAAIRNFES